MAIAALFLPSILVAVIAVATVGCSNPATRDGVGPTTTAPEPAPTKPQDASDAEVLEDQFGDTILVRELVLGPVVLILGPPDASDSSTSWDLDVLSAGDAPVPAPTIHRVLDLSDTPRIAGPIVRANLRRKVRPPGTPIWLDWEGRVRKRFGADLTATTVICIGPDDIEFLRAIGPPEEGSASAVRDAVEAMVPWSESP